MLKFYVVTSFVATTLSLLLELKGFNPNIKAYYNKYGKKTSLGSKIFSLIKLLLLDWTPIVNLFMTGLLIYLLYSSDHTIIKLAEEQRKKEEIKEKEIENILNS